MKTTTCNIYMSDEQKNRNRRCKAIMCDIRIMKIAQKLADQGNTIGALQHELNELRND